MDDSLTTWNTVFPEVFKDDHEVSPEVLNQRLDDIRRLALKPIKRDAQYLRECLEEWRKHELWKHFQLSWDMFCEIELNKPAEWIDLVLEGSNDHDPEEIRQAILRTQQGLVNKLEKLLAKAKEQPLAEHGGDRSLVQKTVQQDDNIMLPQQGTSKEYLARRISRDHPEVLDEIGKGKKYRSVRQAAIAVGIVKPMISIQFPPEESGSQIAGRLYQKLSKEQLIELRNELNSFPLEDCHG